MPCYNAMRIHERRVELERLEKEKQRLKTEAECLRLAREIYEFLEKYGDKK